jgi:hypothetical protein
MGNVGYSTANSIALFAETIAIRVGNTVGQIIPFKYQKYGEWSRVSFSGNAVAGRRIVPPVIQTSSLGTEDAIPFHTFSHPLGTF